MKIQRRDFIKWSLTQAAIGSAALTASAGAFPTKRSGPSILQGATDRTRTQFSIVYLNPVRSVVTDEFGNQILPDREEFFSFQNHPLKISRCFFSNLRPDQQFSLNVFDQNVQIDVREFQTLDDRKEVLRFALLSCMDHNEHKPEIWQNLVKQNPDVLFFIGDAVYADGGIGKAANPAQLWSSFCDSRQVLEIYFSKKLIPTIAVWDDHDFGHNNSGLWDYPYVKESQKNFLQFFAQSSTHCDWLRTGPGIASAFQFNDQLFLLMDDRSFRLKRGSHDRYAHWGEAQETWMLSLIESHRGPVWLINGSQIFPQSVWMESLARDHATQFKAVMKELSGMKSKVIFASGDVHYSEISKIEREMLGYQTFEVTSSAVHSPVMFGAPTTVPNSRRMAATGKRNYILIDSRANGSGAQLNLGCFSQAGSLYFQKKLAV